MKKVFSSLKTYINKVLKVDEESRNAFRNRRILYSGLGLIGSRGVNMIVLIVSLPLCVNYLGAERFGMMETVVALIMITSFVDFGLGFGLQNRMAQLQISRNPDDVKKAISSVFFVLVGITILLTLCFLFIHQFVEWQYVFNVHSSEAIAEAGPAVLAFFLCFICQIPFSVARKVQIGLQESYISEIWVAIGNIAGLVLLMLCVYFDWGLPWIVASIYGSKTLALVGSFIHEFYVRRPELRPDIRYFDMELYRKVYVDGLVFLGLQITHILLTSSDRILIAHLISAEAVAIYSIGIRLVTIFVTPLEAFINPMLPAFNDAIARKEIDWLKNAIHNAGKYLLAFGLVFFVLIITLGNTIIYHWVGAEYKMSTTLLICFAAYFVYLCLNSLVSNIMLTPEMIKKALVIFTLGVTTSVLIKWVLIPQMWISGALLGTIIGMTVCYFMPALMSIRKVFFSRMVT